MLPQILQGIFCAFKVKAQVVVGLLDLFIADCGRPVIGDSSRLNDDVLLIGDRSDSIKEVARRCDRNQFYSSGRSKGDVIQKCVDRKCGTGSGFSCRGRFL